ncbi:MAG TPA: hypothetical protein VF696_00935 [Candidatus Paceibacterota bacterium]|jgi:hypothetical protein
MTRFGWLVLGGLALAALGIALLLWGFARQSNVPGTDLGQEAGQVDPATLAIYTNGTHGFSLFYPASGRAEDTFTDETTFSWRASAVATGTPIVRIHTSGGEVRVGASSDSRALEACVRAGQAEESRGAVTLGEREWQAFSSEALGTEDERRVTSYRTVHEGSCFAVEAFERSNTEGIPPVEDVEFVVQSFTFAR